MTKRYTIYDLGSDVTMINSLLRHGQNKTGRYSVEQRNGYTAIDEIDAKGATLRLIAAGTPKECHRDVMSHAIHYMHSKI